jgi:uncharacterized protein involved in type VI secretion and phage assembly
MDPSYVATAIYTFPVVVPTVAALRSSPADGTTVYYLTSEVYLSFKQTFRNQKYFQDDTAGILGMTIVTDHYSAQCWRWSVEGILGKISEYGGKLHLCPPPIHLSDLHLESDYPDTDHLCGICHNFDM